ncbi:MAG: putative selenium-dependent hydroxylase accessory protein YqeC [Clostridia bacterium]|nr:putative selenium-dependent hydroxylase accessory protein YqeC [Clostridia bacterium]
MFLVDLIKSKFYENGTCMVSIIGGGGKTTTIYRLGKLLSVNHMVLVTSTTAMFRPGPDQVDEIYFNELPDFKPDAKGVMGFFSHVHKENDQKVKGVEPCVLDAFILDKRPMIILNEADGAKHRPIKAHSVREPVIPEKSDIVIVVLGLDGLGKPVSEEWIHRIGEFRRITGAGSNENIDSDHLISLISHPDGLSKDIPDQAEVILLLNKLSLLEVDMDFKKFFEALPSWISAIVVAEMEENKEMMVIRRENDCSGDTCSGTLITNEEK